MMTLQVDDIEALMAFIKKHERKDIPDDVWHLYIKMYYVLIQWNNTIGRQTK